MELSKKVTHYFSQRNFCNCISVFPIFQSAEFSNLFVGISQDWNCKWHKAFSAVQKWKLLDCHAVQIPVSISSYSLESSAGLLGRYDGSSKDWNCRYFWWEIDTGLSFMIEYVWIRNQVSLTVLTFTKK